MLHRIVRLPYSKAQKLYLTSIVASNAQDRYSVFGSISLLALIVNHNVLLTHQHVCCDLSSVKGPQSNINGSVEIVFDRTAVVCCSVWCIAGLDIHLFGASSIDSRERRQRGDGSAGAAGAERRTRMFRGQTWHVVWM